MKKRELFEKFKALGDEDDVIVAIIVPKDEDDESFVAGDDGTSPTENIPADDDATADNEDGTETDFHEVVDAEVISEKDEDTGETITYGAVILDMTEEEDDEDEDDDEDGDDDDD